MYTSLRSFYFRIKMTVIACSLLLAIQFVLGETLNIQDLDPDEGVRDSGVKLMDLDLGLHAIEKVQDEATTMLIGVHGYASRGYEWVYPLQTLDDEQTTVFFFRWDFNQCPRESAQLLIQAIGKELNRNEKIEKISIIGHSMGGVLVSTLVDEWTFSIDTDLHTIAAPLAGMRAMSFECGKVLPDRIPTTVRFVQWRTRHHLDGAFKDLEIDPQVVELDGSLAITLPETYRDRRLGHNWSVSWVAERIASDKQEE